MTSDPIRLLDDPSSAASLRGDLASAADVRLEGLDHAAGLAALQAGLAAEATATGSGVGLSMLTKVGIGAVAIAGALALWLGLGDSESTPASPQVAEVSAMEPVRHGSGKAPTPVPAVTESVAAQPEAAEPAASPEPSVEAAPIEATKIEPMEAEPAAVVTEPAPATDESPRRKGRTARRTTSDSGDAPFDDSVLREARMVAKARSSLAGNPERALTLTEQAEKDFPDGQLVEERRAIAIEALASLGRTEEAERRADRFLAKYGRGAHAAAVRRAIGR